MNNYETETQKSMEITKLKKEKFTSISKELTEYSIYVVYQPKTTQ